MRIEKNLFINDLMLWDSYGGIAQLPALTPDVFYKWINTIAGCALLI